MDGYHHHIATNIWNSRGADERSFSSTGLAEVQIRIDAARVAAIREQAGLTVGDTTQIMMNDPWGTPVTLNCQTASNIDPQMTLNHKRNCSAHHPA